MSKYTRHYTRCETCGKAFMQGKDNKVQSKFCNDHKVSGWFENMSNQGCDVIEPSNLGRKPSVKDIKINECPVVVIDGVKYRDTGATLYQDTKCKKTYLTDEEVEAEKERMAGLFEKKIRKINERVEEEREEIREEGKRIRREKQAKRQRIRRRKGETEEMINLWIQAEKEDKARWLRYLEMEVHKDIGQGLTRVEMAKKHDINLSRLSTVVSKLISEGLHETTKVNYTDEEEEEIIKLYNEGLDYKEIGKRCKRTQSAITNKMCQLRKDGRIE